MSLATEALDDLKGVNPVTLDVRDLSNVMDYLIICSGTSSRHVKSLADNVSRTAKAAGHMPMGVEGEDAGEWVLVDLGDVVVHVMQPATRDFYDLERLWVQSAASADESADSGPD
ncbi:ribosome silencing factor [Congregibacter sp.]|uniref:ribosome silencing factor n=1 Tax=Congregibacter sp. TaxID=2744308 RepID=UPI003F6CA0CE